MLNSLASRDVKVSSPFIIDNSPSYFLLYQKTWGTYILFTAIDIMYLILGLIDAYGYSLNSKNKVCIYYCFTKNLKLRTGFRDYYRSPKLESKLRKVRANALA